MPARILKKTYKRPFMNRLLRSVLAQVLPLSGAVSPGVETCKNWASLSLPCFVKVRFCGLWLQCWTFAPQSLPAMPAATNAVRGEKRGRVAILNGCAQPVLNPGINAATLRLLNRFDIEVATPKGEGCCGSLVHHMGREEQAFEQARHNVDVWTREIETGGAGRDHRDGLRLWHDDQGLRLYAAS